MDENVKGVFAILKPICDSVVLNCNKKNVENLTNVLSEIPPKALQNYQSYILFPIEFQLCKTSDVELKRHLIDCMTKLLNSTYISSVKMLLSFCGLMYQAICSDNRSVPEINTPEELKLSVLECVKTMFHRSESHVIYTIYSRDYYPRLSSLIYLCTQISINNKHIPLRVAALQCVLVLSNVHDKADWADAPLRERVRSVVMLMLPGLVSTCVAVIRNMDTQNHAITVAAIQVWSRVVSLVMEDTEGDDQSAKVQIDRIPEQADLKTVKIVNVGKDSEIPVPEDLKEKVKKIQKQERNSEWLSVNDKKLSEVTKEFVKLQTHNHWKVRRELAVGINMMLSMCSRNLSQSVSDLVCAVLVLSQDDMQQVSDIGKQTLLWFAGKCEQDSGKSLLEMLENSFYSLLTRIPRILEGSDQNEQLACLSLVAGYIRLQGPKLPQVLSAASHLSRLILTLIHAFSLDCSAVKLTKESSLRDLESDGNLKNPKVPWKCFKYGVNSNNTFMLHKLDDICAALREYVDLPALTFTLLEMYDTMPEHSKEITLLLNTILTGGGPLSMKSHKDLVKHIISTYLQPQLWDVPLSAVLHQTTVKWKQEQNTPMICISQVQSNIVQVCLLAEGMGLLAVAVGGDNFTVCLRQCLYSLLKCAGSPVHLVSIAGIEAVKNLASACTEGGGITDLVKQNVDYLSHHATFRLRRISEDSGVLYVLSSVMKYSTMEVLPSLHEIVHDVLVQSCDTFHGQHIFSFLHVFYTFILCMRRWMKIDNNHDDDDDDNDNDDRIKPLTDTAKERKKDKSVKSVVEKLLEYKHCKEIANNFEDPDEGKTAEEMYREDLKNKKNAEFEVKEVDDEDEEMCENNKEVPQHIGLVVEILNRCIHFVACVGVNELILVLKILKEGVFILTAYDDQLLPVVHKIWSPLKYVLINSDSLGKQHAFQLLIVLAHTAKDFIRARTLSDVLPSMWDVLITSSKNSRLKDSGSVYRHSQLYKLQLLILSSLGPLAVDIGLQEKELHQTLHATTPYLSSNQPVPLQEAAKGLYRTIAMLNLDLVWLQLISLSPGKEFRPADGSFKPINMKVKKPSIVCHGLAYSELKKNVSELLEELN